MSKKSDRTKYRTDDEGTAAEGTETASPASPAPAEPETVDIDLCTDVQLLAHIIETDRERRPQAIERARVLDAANESS